MPPRKFSEIEVYNPFFPLLTVVGICKVSKQVLFRHLITDTQNDCLKNATFASSGYSSVALPTIERHVKSVLHHTTPPPPFLILLTYTSTKQVFLLSRSDVQLRSRAKGHIFQHFQLILLVLSKDLFNLGVKNLGLN